MIPKGYLFRISDDQGRGYGFVYIAHYMPVAGRVDDRTLRLPHYVSPVHRGLH